MHDLPRLGIPLPEHTVPNPPYLRAEYTSARSNLATEEHPAPYTPKIGRLYNEDGQVCQNLFLDFPDTLK